MLIIAGDSEDVKLATAIDYSDITEVADEDEADVRKYRDAMATMTTSTGGVLTQLFPTLQTIPLVKIRQFCNNNMQAYKHCKSVSSLTPGDKESLEKINH